MVEDELTRLENLNMGSIYYARPKNKNCKIRLHVENFPKLGESLLTFIDLPSIL